MSVLAAIESLGINQPRVIIAITAALATLYYFRHDSRNYYGVPKSPTYTTSQLATIFNAILQDQENDDLGLGEVQVLKSGKYQPLAWIHTIMFTAIQISSPTILRELLVDGQQQYREGNKIMRAPVFTAMHQQIFSGPNIANLSGEDWKWRRRIMVPLFQPRKLVPQLLPYVVERTNELIELIKSSPKNDGLNIDSFLVFLTFDVICKYLFGKAGPHELDFSALGGYEMTSETMKNLLDGFGKSYPWTLLPIIGKTKWAHEPALTTRKRLRNFVRSAILQCLASEDNTETVAKALAKVPQFDPTTEEGLDLLVSEMLLLIFAGHDTTAHTISFTLGNIAKYPDIQSRVIEEIHEILGPNPLDPSVSAADLSKLTYTTAVLREVGRLYPIAPSVTVSTTQEVEIAGHKIAAGTTLFGNLRTCSMDPTVFAEPFNFDPSRWLLEETDVYADLDGGSESTKLPEINFSVGTHMCLGRNLAVLEMRTVVAMLIQRFEVSFKEGYVMEVAAGILKPRGGMWLKFKERT